MPEEFGAGPWMYVMPLIAAGFIALVVLMIVVIIASRVIRLARGGPDADRLREQLLLQQQARYRRANLDSSAISSQQTLLDLQQQQIATDISNASTQANPPS